MRLGLASTGLGATAGQIYAEDQRWNLDHLTKMFNITALPAIVCYPAPGVRSSSAVQEASSSEPPDGVHSDVTGAPGWVLVDHRGSGGGIDYSIIAKGLRNCSARGQKWRRYVEEFDNAMRDTEL